MKISCGTVYYTAQGDSVDEILKFVTTHIHVGN